MIDIHLEIVRFALGHHAGRDPETIEPSHRLREDLGLEPLDLVVLVLRLEEAEDAPFPAGRLATITTVAELVDVVRAWSRVRPFSTRRRPSVAPAAVIPFRRRSSG